jgi:HPt (histidine-containing phosphotransfer) domain-containing protein
MAVVKRSTTESSDTRSASNGQMISGDDDSDPILDLEGALTRLGGDKALFADLAGFLLEDAPPLYQQLAGAVAANDPDAVRSRAHALKGLVAGCGGVRTAKVAQQLEDDASTGNLNQATTLIANLKSELDELLRTLRCG